MGNSWQRELTINRDQKDVEAFVQSLNSMFDRINLLQVHQRETIEANCERVNLQHERPSVIEYLALLQRDQSLRDVRMCELLKRFGLPERFIGDMMNSANSDEGETNE